MMKRRIVLTAVVALGAALAGWFAPAAARAAEPKAEFSLNFVNADINRVTLHNADLLLRADVGTVRPLDKTGRAVVLAKMTPWSSYRVQSRVKAAQPLKKGDAFGLVAGAVNDKEYYLFRLIQKKGGLFAELLVQRDKQITLVSDFLVGDLVSLSVDATQWHELAVDVDGTNLSASLDGKPILTYGFAGRPAAMYPHAPLWQQDLIAGVAGIYVNAASADFEKFQVFRATEGHVVHSPMRPPRDESGLILPRRPYGQIIADVTRWTINAARVAEPPDLLPDAAKSWDPILVASYLYVNDDGRKVNDIQYPGHNHPPTVIGLVDYHLYSGNADALAKAREIADWNLKYTIPADWKLAGLPLSHFDYRKMSADGSYTPNEERYEPDKAANTALSYLHLYAATGEEKYLAAARHVADALLALQFPEGNFPFRVNARSGEVEHAYSCSVIWYVQMLDLIQHFTPDATTRDRYKSARDRAFAWLLKGPVQDNKWSGFYGDMPSGGDSLDQWTAMDTAMYLIDAREQDPTHVATAERIMAFCREKLTTLDGFHPGVPCLVEQTSYPAVLTHHVARLADTYARLYGATGNEEHARMAQLVANSNSWMQKADGKFSHGLWYHAQANAYILNFVSIYQRIMAELPQTAPDGENHLLRCTVPPRGMRYGEQTIEYTPWAAGQERFKLAKAPAGVEGAGERVTDAAALKAAKAGWFWDDAKQTLDVKRSAGGAAVVVRL